MEFLGLALLFPVYGLPVILFAVFVLISCAKERQKLKHLSSARFFLLHAIFAVYYWNGILFLGSGYNILLSPIAPLYTLSFGVYVMLSAFIGFLLWPTIVSVIIGLCFLLYFYIKDKKLRLVSAQFLITVIFFISCELYSKYSIFKAADTQKLDCMIIEKSFFSSAIEYREFRRSHVTAYKNNQVYVWSYKSIRFIELPQNVKESLKRSISSRERCQETNSLISILR